MSASTTKDTIHWSRTAVAGPDCKALVGDHRTDFVVVGGGLTGTRTALGLAQAGAKVILLESKTIGYGASGRSGGQCNPMWRATPDDLAKRLGDANAERLVKATLSAGNDLFADIKTFQIDCDDVQNGWVQVSHCASAQRGLERLAQGWQAVGAQIDVLDRAQTQAATGSSEYSFGLFHKTAGHVQPLSLTRGFAKTAQAFGATLYEHSPVQAIIRDAGGWKITTPQGSARAPQIILTTNAYTDDLWPGLRQTIYPMVSVSLATAPLTAAQQATILPNKVTFADTRRAIFYGRYDRDNRLVFGCVGSAPEHANMLGGVARLKRGLRTVFPELADIQLEATWGGHIAVTPDLMPHLHEPDTGVLAGLGYSGRGIAMTSVMARTLVKKALGAGDDELAFPVLPLKPIPFHGITKALLPLGAPAMEVRDRLDTLFRR